VISGARAHTKRRGSQEKPAERALRADAQLNRDRILDAAATLFADRGLSVPLDEIARQAGVGVATLYRRFPTRADLAAAIFERNISRYTEAVDRAVADPVPWNGFRGLIFDLCRLQAADAGLRDLLTTAFPASSVIEQTTAEAAEKLRTLIARGQQDGSLRPDLAVADVGVILLANGGVVGAGESKTADSAPEAWRRFAALMVDACSTAPPTTALPPAPPEHQLRRSIAKLPS
jgi:AcrR family transcriptional regulator